MNSKCVWYISKYVVVPSVSSSGGGGRGFMIMKELAKLGHKSIVITSDSIAFSDVPIVKKSFYKEEISNVEIIWLKTFKYSIAKSTKRIISWLHFEFKLSLLNKSKITKPDTIIISSLSILTILNGLYLKRKYQCRLIFEIRDIWPLTLIEEGNYNANNLFIKLLSWVERLGYKFSDHIVGTMPNLEQHVLDNISNPPPVSCVPMGVDIDEMNNIIPISDKYFRDYLSCKSFKVVHAGSIGITNALDTFFKCAESLKDNPNIKFIIVGEGDLKEEYKKLYDHLNNIVFAPKVSKTSVQSVLSHADLLYLSVHKSKIWNFGQSLNKLIDYMYSGKPVVASYSGYYSMINEANCGSFVPSYDEDELKKEILHYSHLSNQELNKIGARGKNWVIKNRNYTTLAKEYEKIIFTNF